MELVDENEGYDDEEDSDGVVDFLAGEELPTFSLNHQTNVQLNRNEREKFYQEEVVSDAPTR